MPLEANALKRWISAHNKQCKQELIRTVIFELTAGASVTREVSMPFMIDFQKESLLNK
jgi:hypothetical protein